jgi:Protein of unknown function (DUF751)
MQDLWNTVSKYPRFLIGVILGVLLNVFAPVVPLLKKPVTAIALVGLLIGSFAFLSFTLRAMLGIT